MIIKVPRNSEAAMQDIDQIRFQPGRLIRRETRSTETLNDQMMEMFTRSGKHFLVQIKERDKKRQHSCYYNPSGCF